MPSAYFSHSPFGTGDIKNGAPTLTMSGGVATLSVAQTGNIGVGDRFTYNTSTIAYVASMNSPSSYNLVTATGGIPSDEGSPVTVNSIGHEYASASAAMAGFSDANHINTSNMEANEFIVNLPGYYDHVADALDTVEFSFPNTITTSPTYRINLYTPQGGSESINNQRFDGRITANRHRFQFEDNDGISVANPNSSVIGIQINWINNTGNYYAGIRCNSGTAGGAADIKIDDCIVDGGEYRGFCIYVQTVGTGSVIRLRQCIGFDTTVGSSGAIFRCDDVDATMNLYHCNARNSTYGIKEDNGVINSYGCVVFDCGDDFFSVSGVTENIACDDAEADVSPAGGSWVNEFPNYATGDFTISPTGNLFEFSPITNADDANIPIEDIAGNARETAAGQNTTVGAFANGEVEASEPSSSLLLLNNTGGL